VTVQQLLGHASIEMTLRYSHPGARERRRAVALLSDGHHMDTTGGSVVLYGSDKSLKPHHFNTKITPRTIRRSWKLGSECEKQLKTYHPV